MWLIFLIEEHRLFYKRNRLRNILLKALEFLIEINCRCVLNGRWGIVYGDFFRAEGVIIGKIVRKHCVSEVCLVTGLIIAAYSRIRSGIGDLFLYRGGSIKSQVEIVHKTTGIRVNIAKFARINAFKWR